MRGDNSCSTSSAVMRPGFSGRRRRIFTPCGGQCQPRIDIGRIVILIADDLIPFAPGESVGEKTQSQRSRPKEGNLRLVRANQVRADFPCLFEIAKHFAELLMILHSSLERARSSRRPRIWGGVSPRRARQKSDVSPREKAPGAPPRWRTGSRFFLRFLNQLPKAFGASKLFVLLIHGQTRPE